MKKLIAILVVFALFTGVAFAQAVSASVETRMLLAEGWTKGDGHARFGAGVSNGTIAFAGANDENTYGGVFKLAFVGADHIASRDEVFIEYAKFDRAFIWWQPIPQVKLRLGHDGDGAFATSDIIRWGHFNMPRNISWERWNQHGYLLGHWDQTGMALEINAVDNLALVFALGFNTGGEKGESVSIEDYFKSTGGSQGAAILVKAAYNIEGTGKASLIYVRRDDWPINTNVGRIGITFESDQLVDGINLVVGGNYKMDDGAKDNLRLAAGVHWTGDDMGVKFRFTGEPNSGGDKIFMYYVDIMPWYKISDSIGTVYCNINFFSSVKSVTGWHINPYLRNSMGGSGDWRVGAMIQGGANTSGAKLEGIAWKLATAWVLSF
jgi:hypothetical protein